MPRRPADAAREPTPGAGPAWPRRVAISRLGEPQTPCSCADALQPVFTVSEAQAVNATALRPIVVHQRLSIGTERDYHVIDLSPAVEAMVRKAGLLHGSVTVFVCHTTCVVRLGELESGFLADFREFMAALVPRDHPYRHNDPALRIEDRPPPDSAEPWQDAHAHFHQMLMGQASETLPVIDGQVQRGEYQRLMLIELNDQMMGVKQRSVLVQMQGWG